MLGRYLRTGAAGHWDPREARYWFESAVAQGIAEAEAELVELSPTVAQRAV
jgi:hypothetical protein